MASTEADASQSQKSFRSLVPARMDRLPWSRFHWLVVIALGVTWILDGLEIQIASTVADRLTEAGTLGLSAQQVTLSASVYLFGEVVGALWFGRMADRLGRRKLFLITLTLYLVASGLTGFSFTFYEFLALRFLAGMGIGGEYAAIHSAIDELIPAHYRGRVDLAISGTYWGGAALASAAQIVFLNPDIFSENIGWRLGFFLGPLIGLAIWPLRRHIPESPRWQMTHGQAEEAERTVDDIEARVRASGKEVKPVPESEAAEVKPHPPVTYRQIAQVMIKQYPSRTILGFTLMTTQSFLYNAIFFTYALVLGTFYDVDSGTIPYFFFPFAIGNLIGPLVLGHLFDTVGRRKMIGGTYVSSGILLAISGYLFYAGALTAVTQTIFWCVIFFIASAAASSGYLTVSEIFPLELRSQAIAFFFAISQFFGGVIAPWLFGQLIGDGESRGPLFGGYLLGAGLMITGGLVAYFLGVDAERKSLESIAKPLGIVKTRVADGAGHDGSPSPRAADGT
ncbi:MFS transporter [Cryptosporangium sp. NPDC051539]|uniref:MFS transporter n=1 Tax=Cryptosporangium sp. NPDC051539 TaxID=3363962 RepID=UPI0037BC159A